MKKIFYLFISLISFSCTNDLEKFPMDAPSTTTFLRTEAELKAAVVGAMAPLSLKFAENPFPIWFEMYSDIAANRDNTPHLLWGNATANDVNTIWNTMYTVIARSNFIIDNIDRVQSASQSVINTSLGEVKFLRAYSYFLLITLYGDVPLIINTSSLEQAYVPRDDKQKIVDFILQELQEAESMLSIENKPNTMSISKGAASALASRVALFNGKWGAAISAAQKVMDEEGTQYELNPDYATITHRKGKTSKEIIWATQFNYQNVMHDTPVSYRSRMAAGFSNRIPVQNLVDSYLCIDGLSIDKSPLYDPKHPFENRDPRMQQTLALPGSIYYGYQFETHKDSVMCWNYNVNPAVRVANLDATHTFATFSGYLWRKYADPTEEHDTRSDINAIVMRYAEVLLNFVEAKVEANQIDPSTYDAINKVRKRAGMPNVPTGLNQEDFRSILRKERKIELAGEGLRYFDIIRWKIADKVLEGPCHGRIPKGLLSSAPAIDKNGTPHYTNVANAKDMRVIQTRNFNPAANYLWPIPDIEIQTNKKLKQNPGY